MRREFSPKIKLAAFERSGGHCESCTRKLYPGDINYDHEIPDGSGGEPTLENCRVLCRSCHSIKTKLDVTEIAKGKRVRRRHVGAERRTKFRGWRRFDGSIVNAKSS